jgi:hypothetical protein
MLDMMELERLEEALHSLGAVLDSRHLSYRLLVAGGSSLLLLGFVDRPTADLDVVGIDGGDRYTRAEPLPPPLVTAVADVALALGLAPTWLNPGPTSLLDLGLPAGLTERITVRRYGGLELHLPGRFDLVCFKLYAAVDQGPRSKHFADLWALDPSPGELIGAARWTITHDPSAGFRSELLGALGALGVEVSDANL